MREEEEEKEPTVLGFSDVCKDICFTATVSLQCFSTSLIPFCAVACRHESVVHFIVLLQQASHCAKCLFISFSHAFCIDLDMKILFLIVFIFQCDVC